VPVDTHCLPTGPPVAAAQVPVTPVNSGNTTIVDATGGAGHRRGIFVFLHASTRTDLVRPYPVTNIIGEAYATFQASLNADGWIFVFPVTTFDSSVNGAAYTISNQENDCAADAGNGSRQLNTVLLWWDHMTNYLAGLYGAGRPTLVGGFSLGAWMATAIALGRTSSLVGWIAHCQATVWSNLNTVGLNFPANTSGMDLSATALNSITIPGIIGWDKADGTVGWGLSTDSGYLGPPQSNTNHMILNAQGAGAPVTSYESSFDEGAGYPLGHLFNNPDAATYCTTPPTVTGWVNTVIDPGVPANTF
jgi:hypothetical protein